MKDICKKDLFLFGVRLILSFPPRPPRSWNGRSSSSPSGRSPRRRCPWTPTASARWVETTMPTSVGGRMVAAEESGEAGSSHPRLRGCGRRSRHEGRAGAIGSSACGGLGTGSARSEFGRRNPGFQSESGSDSDRVTVEEGLVFIAPPGNTSRGR